MTDRNPVADSGSLPPLVSEQLLIEALPQVVPSLPARAHGLVISPGRAQAADRLIDEFQLAQVAAWYVDLFAATAARQSCSAAVEVLCSSDLPDRLWDMVALPVMQRGEAEWTREMLQQSHQQLKLGGWLLASVDNPKDQWLHGQLREMFGKVTCQRLDRGCVYWSRKTQPLKKIRDFSCQFAFRDDEGRLIQVVTRPSVFSHRRLDPGARQLILSAEIGPEDHVLEMGCGCGAVSLAAACQTRGQVFAVDSNARAVMCTQQGAELNHLDNVTCLLNADGRLELPTPVDIALANPPYYGDDRISQHFVDTSLAALRSGGALLVVTKQPAWYESYFESRMEDILVFESGKYFLVCGRRP